MDTSTDKKIALFVECFGDSVEVAKEFFSCSDVVTVCKYDQDRLAAMASLVPILAEDKFKGFYIYGVCVSEDLRGRGLFRVIMDMVEREAAARGANFVCLIPADALLVNTYRKFGYDTEISAKGAKQGKVISLLSDDFRKFAFCKEDIDTKRMSGLLKSFDTNIFSPCDREFIFSDDMGDV